MRDVTSANEVLVRRFYEELWNGWDLGLASELLAPDLRFRGTLGATGAGIGAFMRYAETVWRTFPDWHNRIDELLGGGDTVVARLTWSGTHLGELLGVAATGQRVSYVGAGIFNIRDARIQEAWVVGDTQELWRALGVLTAPGEGGGRRMRLPAEEMVAFGLAVSCRLSARAVSAGGNE